eukprot:5951613-Pleurochrysis_carterae.AAC.1
MRGGRSKGNCEGHCKEERGSGELPVAESERRSTTAEAQARMRKRESEGRANVRLRMRKADGSENARKQAGNSCAETGRK